MNIFLNSNRQLRNIWWAAVFILVLALITVPLILVSRAYKWEMTISQQAFIVIVASWICQSFRRQPLSALTGAINGQWFANFIKGSGIGAALMLLPALFLYMGGWITMETSSLEIMPLLSATGIFISVAVAEELLFRGFLFQRLMAGFGTRVAQPIMAGYFFLIHLNNPGMTGSIKLLASVNIFLASIMFGLAFTKTKSLAMPIGIHFMANWMQGTVLGFGVSGNVETSILKPIFNKAPQWLTRGSFGLEASLAGLLSVVLAIIFLYFWKPEGKEKYTRATTSL